jgi:hypothetical protein
MKVGIGTDITAVIPADLLVRHNSPSNLDVPEELRIEGYKRKETNELPSRGFLSDE